MSGRCMLRCWQQTVGLLLLQFVGGCQSGTADREVLPSPGNEWRALPPDQIHLQAEPIADRGLTCDKCIWVKKSNCGNADKSPIIATVSDIQIVSSTVSCSPDEPGPHFPGVCDSTRMYRFGRLEYLRKVSQASATDSFEGFVLYNEVYSPDVEAFPATGPLLQPGRRYLIFATPDRKDMGVAADWYIHTACEIP